MPLVGLSKNLSRHYKATGAWRVMKYKEGLTPSAKISPRVQILRVEVVFLRKARINVYILNANYIRFFALHR